MAVYQTAGPTSIALKHTMSSPVYISQLWLPVVTSSMESNFFLYEDLKFLEELMHFLSVTLCP